MVKLDNVKMDRLIEMYRETGITLVGLNDSQLINVMNPKGRASFDLVVETFRQKDIETASLNAGSSFLNKSEHAKSIIENDLTIREIEALKSYSYLAAYSKVFKDIGLPFGLPKVMERAFRTTASESDEKDMRISEYLQRENSVVITSFIANNIMRAVANDPFNIKKDYKNKDKSPRFNYTVNKMNDSKILDEIIESTKTTYDTLLSRTNADVYGMGLFLPNTMQKDEGLKVFKGFIDQCNGVYSEICKTIGINYIDVTSLGSKTGNVDFHAEPEEIKELILASIYETKMKSTPEKRNEYLTETIQPMGLDGMIVDAMINNSEAKANLYNEPDDTVAINTAYEREKELMIMRQAQETIEKSGKSR